MSIKAKLRLSNNHEHVVKLRQQLEKARIVHREENILKQKAFWAKPENRLAQKERITLNHSTPEYKAQARQRMLKQHQNPEFVLAQKRSTIKNIGKKRTLECRKKLSEQKIGDKNPTKRPEVKDKISKALKGNSNWQNSKHRPNNGEQLLFNLINTITNDYRYNQDEKYFQLKNRIKLPDFYSITSSKVIEYFGVYWHKDPNEENTLIAEFAEIGVDCLIIWDYEMKNVNKVVQKIKLFITKGEK